MPTGNPLEKYFRKNQAGRRIHKWLHYFEIYHRHLQRFRGKRIVVVEFGVQYGGSLQMWRKYFGRRAKIYGVDIDPRCKRSDGRRTKVFIGDQADRDFLQSIVDETGPIDVVIEDGGHFPAQQIATFEVLYPHMKPDGVFLIEDLHTSYWKRWEGGYRRPGTFIEYAKDYIDKLNAWHSQEKGLVVDEFTRTTKSIHVYDSIIVFERGVVQQPTHEKIGVAGF